MTDQWSPPPWLEQLLTRYPKPRQLPLTRPPLGPGQLWLAEPDDPFSNRVLLLVCRALNRDFCQAMLCSSETDLASDTDAVLERKMTGYYIDLLAHGNLYAPVPTRLLLGCQASVPVEIVEQVWRRGMRQEFSADLGRGLPIRGQNDPRWQFKLDELARLRTVQAAAHDMGY